MKTLSNLVKFLPVLVAVALTSFSCVATEDVTEQDLNIFKLYDSTFTLIFSDELQRYDTLTFEKKIFDTVQTGEATFYITEYKEIIAEYYFSDGSYHKKDDPRTYSNKDKILYLRRSWPNDTEIYFGFMNVTVLHTGLHNKETYDSLNNVPQPIRFVFEDTAHIQKWWITSNYYIQSFLYDVNRGVLSYRDYDGHEWKRLD